MRPEQSPAIAGLKTQRAGSQILVWVIASDNPNQRYSTNKMSGST